ncbi:hypothetical protein K458DRAFT_441784 [Lentithecium fluviatile CBS 122367]|uniref:Uncharacterized protein n=1 Tax=Lentithecium fluviatile CBS 122367 TaxID=1168545 RepID=A0A6G1J7K1_9PLEO|nr:hypothetical protein K458DRAFT_441784 [Lentithecium fluviatile CBS 122367]
MMVASFLVGICLALSQHLLYANLHHKSMDDEGEKVRMVLYGRAFAYFSKIAFGGCCILVFRQRIWRTFRSSALSVLSIDQLFLATEDPSLFVNWETISNAPLAVAMALVIWLIPLATIIFSPGALSFGWYQETGSANISVPNLNFSMESYADWRTPIQMADGTKKRQLMFYNTTDMKQEEEGWFDYFDQPSSDLTRVSLMTAYSLVDHPLNRPDARIKSCGGNYNCTYTASFVGPGYKCEMVANGPEDDAKLAELGAPFNTSELIPRGQHVYLSDVDKGEYNKPQYDQLGEGGKPNGTIPDGLGVFKAEPVLWIGYSINSTVKLAPDDPLAKNWTARYDPHIFRCIHYETKYTIKYNYTDFAFTMETEYEYLSPIVDTNFTLSDNGTVDYNNPSPAANYVSPRTDVPRYKKVAAYHAMGQSLREFLRGKIELTPELPKGPSFARVDSEIAQTTLVSNMTSTPTEDLPDKLQRFYGDMLLSLFSAPKMLVVSETMAEVQRSRFQSTFIYSPAKLWGCYAPVIFFTLIILLMGAWTIHQDGTTFSVGFSRIMVTTRNQTLDDISRGACLGNDPFPMELMHTKLQFGVLNDYGELEYIGQDGLQGVGHCAFGVPSEVSFIQRGVPYAGLRRRPERRITGVQKEKTD